MLLLPLEFVHAKDPFVALGVDVPKQRMNVPAFILDSIAGGFFWQSRIA